MKLMALKRELVDRVFEEVLSSLPRRSPAEYAGFLAALVAPAVATEPARLELGRSDLLHHGPELLRLVSSALAARHPGWPVTIAGEPGDFAAGVVVRAGRSVHDFSLPALLARQRERWELPVGRILFTA
jgi:vacuolar-type H+-ATPase subunit E/Vma4